MTDFILNHLDTIILAIPALWLFYHSKYWPVKNEQWRARFEAHRIDIQHEQRQDDLSLAYLQSESAVAQQRLAELLQDSQEFLVKVVHEKLEVIEKNTAQSPDTRRDVMEIKHRIQDILTYNRMLISLLKDNEKI